MKYTLSLFTFLLLFGCASQKDRYIDTSDVQLFWTAYDKVKSTNDTLEQVKLINELYIEKGSEGLEAIMEARRYTAQSYVTAINHYPQYWESVRPNTLTAAGYAEAINQGIEELRKLYPPLKPAKIYFTIGALRTGGTTLADKVLIGTEIALADSSVVTSELETDLPHLPNYFRTNKPEKSIVFNNVHEYVHTQQKTTIANSLLSRTLIEGSAEFVAEKALNTISPTASVVFGKNNDQKIKEVFVKEMFTQFEIMWFWSNANNQFGVGDLGYYVGYAICKSFYENATDKPLAIQSMIELDYQNEEAVYDFINASHYFDKTIAEYKAEFDSKRPTVIGISEFSNTAKNVDPEIKTMTIEFSEEMNKDVRNFRLGPLGEENLLTITDLIGWSEDGKKLSLSIELKPSLQQQVLVTDIFRSKEGYLLAPYLIDITTR